ncbi:hypothetical protein [Novosphingobium malaysiense]|uniref:hypothetical protein n=1 Tax=Novosphingobium malaysiense TaxID=1348853 RepID=UPI0018CE4421|nr:hypothetical protein [Novosphingobium malaysiense]
MIEMILEEDKFDHTGAEIEPMQIEAANALFLDLRGKIPVLDRRAREAGIERIKRFEDIVPLLFAHTVYKSYPESFIEKGRWHRMLAWLTTLSADDWTHVDVEGVKDADEWLDRLKAAGCTVLATSGSSGKCSFLPASMKDRELKHRHFRNAVGWPFVKAGNQYDVFWTGPIEGPNSAIEAGQMSRDHWARAGAFHNLIKEPLRITDVAETAALNRRMREGKASPSEIEAFQQKNAEAGKRISAGIIEFIDTLLEKRHQPVYVNGLWAQHMQIIERARSKGIPDGDFHPDSVINAGGGIKGIALPDDYKEQVAAFYGDVVRPGAYGMTEMAQVMPRCEAGRYHRPPGLIWLQLDQPGENLINASEGVVEGRFAFLDLIYTGRWGGCITGDKVEIDWGDTCPCGRPGPTILDTIVRYAQAGEEDHIGCAGTIDGYVKGAMAQ